MTANAMLIDPTVLVPGDSALVPPIEVLFALGVLAANLFYQRRAALSKFLDIEPATYRLLRLLPLVAIIDAAGSLLALVDLWLTPSYPAEKADNSTKTQDPTTHKVEKCSTDEVVTSSTWTRFITIPVPSKRIVLGFIAGIQLFKLTVYTGVPFSAFCGWAFFIAYLLNEIVYHYAPEGPTEPDQSLPPPAVTAQKSQPVAASDSLKSTIQFLLVWALILEFIHLAWLGQFFVPRRLWMDWGPPQIAETDNSNLTFAVPPGMPPRPTLLPGQEIEEIVVGFWPSHTTSGSFFYFLAYTSFTLLMSFGMTFAFMMPFMVVCYIYWVITVGGLIWLGYWIYGATKDTALGQCVSQGLKFVEAIIRRVYTWPKWLRFCIQAIVWPPMIVVGFLVALAGAYVLFLPMKLFSSGVLDLESYMNFLKIDKFIFICIDRPEGSYAQLTGLLIGALTLGFRSWGIPRIIQKPRLLVTSAERRYWTAVWVISMMSALTILYYQLSFDPERTHAPAWSRLITWA